MDHHHTNSFRTGPRPALLAAIILAAVTLISPMLDGPSYLLRQSAHRGYDIPLLGVASAAGAVVAALVAIRRAELPSCLLRAAALGLPALAMLLLAPISRVSIYPTTPRHQCAAHLKQIGNALRLYSVKHANRYPNHLDELITAGLLDRELLHCPAAADGAAPYVYLGRGMRNPERPEVVVAYEPPGRHAGAINLLFGDGSVTPLSGAPAERTLRLLKSGINPPVEPPSPPDAPTVIPPASPPPPPA